MILMADSQHASDSRGDDGASPHHQSMAKVSTLSETSYGRRCFFFFFFCFSIAHPSLASVSDYSNALVNSVRRQGIDSSLRNYALLALSQVDTGTACNVSLPPALSGIQSQALQLASDSLQTNGLTFNQFSIPQGAVINANGTLLVLVYRKIYNFTVYSLPAPYLFGGPVVGIVTYAPSNSTTDDLEEVQLTFSESLITVELPLYRALGETVPLCAFFSPDGTVTFDNLTASPNVCTSATLGDFALVLESPSEYNNPPSAPIGLQTPLPGRKGARNWKFGVAVACLALVGLAFCAAIVLVSVGLVEQVKVAIMDRLAHNEEALETSSIGTSRAPTAAGVRTKPALEMDMAHFKH